MARLTAKQERVALMLAAGMTAVAAAAAVPMGVRTVFRWLEDSAFRQAVSQMRDRLLGEAVGKLLGASGKAVAKLESNLDAADLAIANRAALGILGHLIKGVEFVDLARRVADLEERHGSAKRPSRPAGANGTAQR